MAPEGMSVLLTGMRSHPMECRRFGSTDLKVSAIGFGCWEISGTYGAIDAAELSRRLWRRRGNFEDVRRGDIAR
jgi:hypothetical protein